MSKKPFKLDSNNSSNEKPIDLNIIGFISGLARIELYNYIII